MPASSSLRIPLSTGGDLRFVRWVGRLLAAGALWPLYYGLTGPRPDAQALAAGAMGVTVGLALWWWSGYRLRNPRTYLELDPQASEARLWRDGLPLARCTLAALPSWRFRTWQTTSTRNGSTTTTTWHAARSNALGDHDLYFNTTKEPCQEWTATVERALRNPGDHPQIEPWARGLDRRVQALSGLPATLALTGITLAWIAFAALELAKTSETEPIVAVALAIVGATFALGWAIAGKPTAAALVAGLMGLAFTAKPWLAPITWEPLDSAWGDAPTGPQPFSPTSETHLYFLLPGLALFGLGALILGAARARRLRAQTAQLAHAERPGRPEKENREAPAPIQTRLPPPKLPPAASRPPEPAD